MGVGFFNGASGRIEGCDFCDFRNGSGVAVGEPGTSPLVSRNTSRNCKRGVHILSNMDSSWSLGECNVVNACERDVLDWRI